MKRCLTKKVIFLTWALESLAAEMLEYRQTERRPDMAEEEKTYLQEGEDIDLDFDRAKRDAEVRREAAARADPKKTKEDYQKAVKEFAALAESVR